MKKFALIVMVACGGTTPMTPGNVPKAKQNHGEIDQFVADEDRIASVMAAADARIAARGIAADPASLHHATMGAILAEDPSLAMEGDRPDVLSFDVRARAIDAAAGTLARWKTPPEDVLGTRPALEMELLGRFIASEKLRLASERELPRSATILFGALAKTWRTPDAKDVGDQDDWLARRFAEVTKSLGPKSLTADERDELDDALDPLEHLLEGFAKSHAALVELRLAVQRVDLANRPRDRWDVVSARLAVDTGSKLSSETLLAFLSTEAKSLRDEIDKLVGVKLTEDVAARAADVVLAPDGTCRAPFTGSKMRALGPPEERAFDCTMRARIITARTADENFDVLVAMHDAVVAASWALVFARGGDAEAIALGTPHLLAPLSPTASGKLTRFAATHPVEAISRALSIEWIMRNGLGDAALRAETWKNWGDAPLDIVEREVHPQRREKSYVKSTK
ncbi:MAG TPA: hypothetical protein VH054_09415 [Polyangiaceae bacterium]|nr:hypothetical protein [Polyangiaceae bacterium]